MWTSILHFFLVDRKNRPAILFRIQISSAFQVFKFLISNASFQYLIFFYLSMKLFCFSGQVCGCFLTAAYASAFIYQKGLLSTGIFSILFTNALSPFASIGTGSSSPNLFESRLTSDSISGYPIGLEPAKNGRWDCTKVAITLRTTTIV